MNKHFCEISLDELPQHSSWPARIMGIDRYENRVKNAAELMREYETEKWGPLWESYQKKSGAKDFSTFIRDVSLESADVVVWSGGRIVKMSAWESYQALIDFVSRALSPYLRDAPLIELGAGYGRIVLSLIQRGLISDRHVWAMEYAPSGAAMAAELARASGWKIQSGLCDFMAKPMINMRIPPGGLVFTAFATSCVPELPASFVEECCAMRPHTVVHIEPLYEQCDSRTLLGMMQRRYIEMNDYNRNLLTLLQHFEREGRIHILEVSKPLFGNNPFLVASIVAWRPVAG